MSILVSSLTLRSAYRILGLRKAPVARWLRESSNDREFGELSMDRNQHCNNAQWLDPSPSRRKGYGNYRRRLKRVLSNENNH